MIGLKIFLFTCTLAGYWGCVGQPLEQEAQYVARSIFQTMEPFRDVPEIKVVKGDMIAQTRELPTPHILLGPNAFKICRALKADSVDALAVIIGHELAHIHLHHSHVDRDKANGEFLELQADYLGLVKGFNCGFATFNVLPLVLDQIKQTDPNYRARITQNNDTANKMEKLFRLQQAANFFIATKQYDYALQVNSYLKKQLNLPLLINNEAYIDLSLVLEFNSDGNQFQYPLKWDAGQQFYKLQIGKDRFPDGSTTEEKLESVRLSLERLSSQYPDYEPAANNLICYHLIAGNFDSAKRLIDAATKLNPNDQNLIILKSIYHLKKGEINLAESLLQKIQENPIAQLNLKVARAERKSVVEKAMDWSKMVFDKALTDSNEKTSISPELLNLEYKLIQVIPGERSLSVSFFEESGFSAFELNIGFGAFYVKKTSRANNYQHWPSIWATGQEYLVHFEGSRAFHYQYFFNPF